MSFLFPELNVSQIISSLRELCSIHIQESFFSKPDSMEWQAIFTKLLCEITDSTEDCIKQPLLTMEFDYPELYSDSVPVINLAVAMQKVMPTLYMNDFSSRDIILPTSARLRKICSAIINFLRFKHTRLDIYDSIKLEVENEREHYETVLKGNEELKKKINTTRAERAQQEPEVVKVQEEIDKVSLLMQEHHRSKQLLTKTISDLKTKTADRKAKEDQLKCEILKRQEDEDKLSQKIVQSPAKVRAEQEGLKQQVEDLKETSERKRHRLTEVQNQRKESKLTSDYCEKGLQLLEHIQASVDKETEIANQMTQILDKIHEGQEQVRELNMRGEQLKEMLTMRQEKLSKMSLLHQNKVKAIKEQIEGYKEEKENLDQKQSCDSEMRGQLLEYKKKVEEEVRNKQETFESKIQALKNMYGRVLENTDLFNNNIAAKWDLIRQVMK